MKVLVSLIALSSLAQAEPDKPATAQAEPEVARRDGFPGPDIAPAVTTGEAFVVVPLPSDTRGTSRESFVLASIVEAMPHALIVNVASHRVEVPGVLVAPLIAPTKLKVGTYVLFPRDAVLAVGRITKATKVGYTISYDAGDRIDAADVPAAHVIPLDGKLHFAEPVWCEPARGTVLAVYIAPAHKPQDQYAQLASGLVDSEVPQSWVVSNGELLRCRDVVPLRIAAFAKGAHVLVHGRPFVEIGGGEIVPIESATVVSVGDGGLTYEVHIDTGDDRGLTRHLSAGELFAR